MVMHGGNSNRSRVEMKIGGQQFFDRSENRYAEFLFCKGRVSGVRINGRDEGNSLDGCLQFTIDTKVIAAKRAATDYGNT